ncbi:DUF3987 domain-containing protein [Microcoleus sp. B3-D7]|uniref:DUF3987 domain-containing protein n=1 Tax=Microcoleus sp. B3-D7 TaxID=2818659 RepID=UPI002FD2D4F2
MSPHNPAANAASSQKLTNSSKSNPCPVCGRTKDGDCRISHDGKMVLCHQNFDHAKTQQPDVWHFDGASSDNRCGVYVFKEPTTKSIRPKQTRYWEYPARDGSRLVRVGRQDDGAGKKRIWQERWDNKTQKWVSGLGEKDDPNRVNRADIPIYRYAEVREAIAKGELPYIVEGEPCADIFWKLGLPATTNIGGGGKFTQSDAQDLQGAKVVVIVPDRDKKGIEHAEKVAGYFPDTLWLYPYPESKVWGNLPSDHGLDVADWVEQYKLSADDIAAAIGEKRFLQSVKIESASTLQEAATATLDSIEEAIDFEIKSGVTGSRLSVGLNKIAAFSGFGIREIRQIYTERVGEQQQADSRADTAVELKQLLASKSAKLSLLEILPKSLAEPIEKLAKTLNLRAEGYLLALLVQSGALLKNGTSTMLYPQSQFKCRPNYFGALVAESSQKKTPVIRAIITDPMERLLARSEAEYKFAKENYEAKLQAWLKAKDSDEPKPEEPTEKTYIFTKATGEGIVSQAQKIPEQGMLYLCDELAGAFKSANQYRGGKGSDEEDLLEYWSGGGAIVLRVGGLSANVRNLSLSIFGNIQPKVLAGFVGDGSDANGKFARFDFVQQPLSATKLHENAPFISLTPMLTALYENLDALPAMQFELDREARKLFINFYNHCEEERVAHPKQGMRAMLGKAAEKVGKLATILHCINAAHNSTEPLQNISADCVRAAIKFVMFTTDQALSLNMESCEPETLAPNLVKILDLAERKGGTVSLRDVGQVFGQKYRPTSQQIQEWFIELVELQYGEIEKKGRSISFMLRPQPTTPTLASNPLPVRNTTALNDIPAHPQTPTTTTSAIPSNVGDCGNEGVIEGDTAHTLKPLTDEGFDFNVGDVGENPTDLDQLVFRVQSAQTWAEVEAVWNGNEELKAQIKAALTREELARIGRLYKAANPSNSEE